MFKYKQKVKLNDGFYEGTGEIVKKFRRYFWDETWIAYHVKLDIDDSIIVEIPERNLEPLPDKLDSIK